MRSVTREQRALQPHRQTVDSVLSALNANAVMAAGTLLIIDASLPDGLIEGSGSVSYAQTMAFTTMTMFQLFNVFNARTWNCPGWEGDHALPQYPR